MTQALEGIENMVLLILVAVVVATIGILYIGFHYFFKPLTQRVRRGILPEYQEVVDFTRAQLRQMSNGDERDASNPLPPGSDVCPVCMEAVSYAIETNCGHIFCSLCITTYWHTGRWTGPVDCPMCRSSVNLLLPRFTSEEQREAKAPVNENESEPLARRLLAEIAVYNRRHSGAPLSWWEQIRDLPVLLPYVVSRLFSADGLNIMYRARIFIVLLFGLVYVLLPVDLIPEAFLGFLGVLDDVAIFLIVAVYAVMVYREYVAQQQP